MRRGSVALRRKLSFAVAKVGDTLKGHTEEDTRATNPALNVDKSTSPTGDERRPSGFRRRSSNGRQPCGHNMDEANEYNMVAMRVGYENAQPLSRRKSSAVARKNSVAPVQTDYSMLGRRTSCAGDKLSGRRRSSAVPRPYHTAEGHSAIQDHAYTQPNERRLGKLPEGRSFRQPVPMTLSEGIAT